MLHNTLSKLGAIYGIGPQRLIILCDFDGTISLKDVTDELLAHFCGKESDELEAQWLACEIGSRECMSKQIALMDASKDEVDSVLAQIEIDPNFKAFVNLARAENVAIHVVSDGLDYAIKSVLSRHGLDDLPIFANQLWHDNDRSWRLDFPYAGVKCVTECGNCKCEHVKQQRRYFNNVLYVGDGRSDFCVSGQTDLVLAKDKLIQHCQKNAINYHAINNFADALRFLPSYLNDLRLSEIKAAYNAIDS